MIIFLALLYIKNNVLQLSVMTFSLPSIDFFALQIVRVNTRASENCFNENMLRYNQLSKTITYWF